MVGSGQPAKVLFSLQTEDNVQGHVDHIDQGHGDHLKIFGGAPKTNLQLPSE